MACTACTALVPPTVPRMTPSTGLETFSRRTRSARARPRSARRMCRTSASSGWGPSASVTTAPEPAAATALPISANTTGSSQVSRGTTTASRPEGRESARSVTLVRRTSICGLSTRTTAAISSATPVTPPGVASTSIGASGGKDVGTGRRCRPPPGRGERSRTGRLTGAQFMPIRRWLFQESMAIASQPGACDRDYIVISQHIDLPVQNGKPGRTRNAF